MSLLKKVARTGRDQRGFTLVEVVLATFIMAFTSVGLIGMFNSTAQLSNLSMEHKDAERYARTISESILAIPFYRPYDGTHNVDVDDYFWGTAADRGGSITNNSWSTAPYISYSPPSNIADSRYTVSVKMAYVLSNLSTENMISNWVPKDTTEAGLDKPTGSDAEVFHLIQYQVKVAWNATLAGGTSTSYETYTALMSDTQYEANLGVATMINVDKSSRWGSGGANSATAPHTASGLGVQITGYGFVTGQAISASLVMQGVADIPINGLTRVDDKTLSGTVDLNTGNGTAPPWQPKRDPGQYTVKVTVGFAYAYAFKAFTVEFPVPSNLTVTPTSSDDSYAALAIKATGTNVLNLGYGTSPYNTAYAGATIRLIQYKDANNNVIASPSTINAIINDSSHLITYGNTPPGGYGVSNWVQAYFNLQGQAPGQYYVEVCNCQNNQVALKPGDVASSTTSAPIFTLTHATPIISNAYVTGSTNATGVVTNEVYVASGETRRFAYKSRAYHYSLRVDGQCLGGMDTVKLGVGGDPSTGGTNANFVVVSDTYGSTSSVQVSGDHTFLTVNFNFASVPDTYTTSDNSLPFWIYAYSSATPSYSAYKTGVFQIRKPKPILYRDAVYASGPGDFYHNCAPVTATLYGECLDSSAYNIKYMSGNYSGMGNQTWQVGSSDGGMVKGSPTNNGTTWQTSLNLIHCLTGANNIWVETNDATPQSDKTVARTATSGPSTYTFNVNVVAGPGALLSQSSGAVTITNWFDHWYYSQGFTEQVLGPTPNTEGTTLAKAEPGYNTNIKHGSTTKTESTYSYFTLKCQGLRDASVVNTTTTSGHTYGATTVSIYSGTSHTSPIYSGTYSVPDPASAAAAQTDRTNLFFTITTSHIVNMPTSTGNAGIGFTAYDSTYTSVSNWNDARFSIYAIWADNNGSAD